MQGLLPIGSGNSPQYRITSANGVIRFGVGATLDLGANQVDGLYTGTYSIVFNYQ